MTKILVTGSEGFLGSHLYSHLKENGYDVFGTYNNTKPKTEDKNKYYCDLEKFSVNDLKKFFDKINPDIVIHLAAISSPNSSASSQSFMQTNVIATQKLCELLPEKKLVFASSVVCYGNEYNANEDITQLKPTTLYGATKAASENIINAYSKTNDLNFVNLRFSAIVGDNLTHGAIMDIRKKVKQDSCVLFGKKPGSSKPYLHIEDACLFTEKILASKYNNKVYNVCPDDNISILEIKRTFDPENKCQETWDETKVWKGDNRIIKCDNSHLRAIYKMYYPTSKSAIKSLVE